jgi:hypothetical protein
MDAPATRPARLAIDSPVACVIRVQGALDPRWSDYLGGLRIAAADGATTELRGELLDQAALLGVLTTLYDRRLPLLSMACEPAHAGPPAPTPAAAAIRSPAGTSDAERNSTTVRPPTKQKTRSVLASGT